VTVNYATADGTATAGSDYTAISSTQLTFLAGETTKPVNVTVSGDTTVEPDETFNVNLSGATNAVIGDSQGVGTITNDDGALVVISQVYGGGGNASATIKNDFVEIFNRSTSTVDISGWSVQYVSATATTGSYAVTNLCSSTSAGTCTLAAGHYYLVKLASGGSNGTIDITGDITGTTDMSATAGKVALVNNRTALSATSCQATATGVVDYIGYGTTANCFEGAGRAPAPSNTTADFRASSGCTDTNVNSSDFSAAAPGPRNSSSAAHTCP